jgi:hypothetical protein
MHRTLTVVAVLAVLLATVQLYAQDIPKIEPPRMPEPPRIWPPQPPIREPPIWPPWRPIIVELKGYIYAIVVDPIDWRRTPGRTEYYFRTVDGRVYRLQLRGAKLYLCDSFTNYVGTGRLVVVKGILWPRFIIPFNYVLFAIEIRDPAYPHCTANTSS